MKSLTPASPSSLPPTLERRFRSWSKCLAASTIAAFVTSALATPSTTIVISQVYGGGGNSGSVYKNDFIELHNISGSTVDVTGWSVQYKSSTGVIGTYEATTLTGTIAAGAYYLVQEAAAGGGTTDLPTPNSIGTIIMGASAGRVALVNNATPLAATSAANASGIVDFVGFGGASTYEGSAPTAAPSATNSVLRKDSGSQDTDQNSSDFLTGAASSRNSSTLPYVPTGDITPPNISSRIPAVLATNVSIGTSVSITFDEAIVAGAGTVHLFKEAGVSDVAIPIGPVIISPNTKASFTPTAPLEAGETYYVLIDATAFTDTASAPNPFPGISDETAWTFTTTVAPVLDTFLVGNGAANTATPNVTLNYTSSGGTATEYITSELSDFTGASWTALPAKSPVFALSAGDVTKTVYFKLRNSAGETAALSDTIERVTYANPGTVLITQYYKGSSNNKYIEINNTTAGSIDLSTWHLVRWTNDQAEDWKTTGSSVAGTSGDIALSGFLAAGQTAVFANTAAVTPILAANASAMDSKISHTGNDSYGLYDGAVSPENLRDVIGFTDTGDEGANTSFVRISAASGFDFAIGNTVLDFPAVWQEVLLATVDAAVSGQNEYLGTYPGTPSGYTSWASTNVEGQTADFDFDGDGLDNGTEYFMGTAPGTFTPNPGLVAGTVTWPRAAGTTIGSFKVEVSSNLTDWEDAAANYSANLGVGVSQVTFTPPDGAGKFFVRLSVTP